MNKNFKAIATVSGDDNTENAIITVGIQQYEDEEGTYFDVVASNGDEVSQGGRMARGEAIEAVCKVWGHWNTFELIEE